MKRYIWMTLLVLLVACAAEAAEDDAVKVARKVIARENKKLAEKIDGLKTSMAVRRMRYVRARMFGQAIKAMEATVALHSLILKEGNEELLVTAAKAIVHKDLEEYYQGEAENKKKMAGAQVEQSLKELEVLKEWRKKEEKAAKEISWTLRIVPTRSGGEPGAMIDCATKGSSFYVVLTNTSGRDLSVWREWCSWGYNSLSFQVTLPGGKPFHVKKKPRGWKKNFPDPFVVKKGNHFVYSIRFDNIWEGFPEDWKNRKVKIKAVYEVKDEDGQAKRHKVWTGKIGSPEIEVTLHR